MDTKLMDSLSLVNLSEMSFLNFYFSLVDTSSFILTSYYFSTKVNFICLNQYLKLLYIILYSFYLFSNLLWLSGTNSHVGLYHSYFSGSYVIANSWRRWQYKETTHIFSCSRCTSEHRMSELKTYMAFILTFNVQNYQHVSYKMRTYLLISWKSWKGKLYPSLLFYETFTLQSKFRREREIEPWQPLPSFSRRERILTGGG